MLSILFWRIIIVLQLFYKQRNESSFVSYRVEILRLTMDLYSMLCRSSLSSLSEYLASLFMASTGPLSICVLIARNKVYKGVPTVSYKYGESLMRSYVVMYIYKVKYNGLIYLNIS